MIRNRLAILAVGVAIATSGCGYGVQAANHMHRNRPANSVVVFSQSDLEEIWATLSYSSVGPIWPPETIQRAVQRWDKFVSPAMLKFVPADQRTLDAALIADIQLMVQNEVRVHANKPVKHKPWVSIRSLPGFVYKIASLPQGGRHYWWPAANKWPRWAHPVEK